MEQILIKKRRLMRVSKVLGLFDDSSVLFREIIS